MNYYIAKQAAQMADEACTKASDALNLFPKGAFGLTPDDVKASPEFKAAMKEYNLAFACLRAANTFLTKNYGKELRADRAATRAAKIAAI